MIKRVSRVVLILSFVLFAGSLLADEGMWLYNNLPQSIKDQIKKKYKFEPTQAWLDHLRLASVRLGASASFVSPDGLIFTNHHVGAGCIHDVSTNDKDYMKVGFFAASREQEPKCPNMEASVLTDIQDVTDKMNAGVQANMSAVEVAQAQRAAASEIEKGCTDEKTRSRCQVVSLYAGTLYHLYKYKRYTDVRLVFAPEYDTAFFGGDPDNFMYPRYDLDITFLRAYEDGKPARPEHYLKWSKTGVKEGDLVFVSGHPGSTNRLDTVAQMEFLRDVQYPYILKSFQRSLDVLGKFAAQTPENARLVERQIFGISNSRKATEGYQSGLLDKSLFAKKVAEEKALRDAVANNPKLKEKYGDPWAQIESAMAVEREIYFRNAFIEGMGGGRGSNLMGAARMLVRAAAEKQKAEKDRLPGFSEAALKQVERRIGTNPMPIRKDLEQIMLANTLSEMQERLGANDPAVQKVLRGKTPEDAAAYLVQNTKLDDPDFRKKLYDGGQTAIDFTCDPMIVVMREIDAEGRALRKRMDEEVAAVERRNLTQIAKINFELKGLNTPPDATGTLRLSYGVVKGYVENGKKIPPYTTMGATFDYAAEKGNNPPYKLTEPWMNGKAKINPKTPFNFVSTADIIGGNSGSPVVNKNAEVVGIIFDGNWQANPWRFMYDDVMGRAVAVDSRSIIEALRNIYSAGPLADELLGATEAAKPAAKKAAKAGTH